MLATKGVKPLEIVCGTVKGLFKEYVSESVKPENGWKSYIAEIVFQK
jgi:hypothetical protein